MESKKAEVVAQDKDARILLEKEMNEKNAMEFRSSPERLEQLAEPRVRSSIKGPRSPFKLSPEKKQ